MINQRVLLLLCTCTWFNRRQEVETVKKEEYTVFGKKKIQARPSCFPFATNLNSDLIVTRDDICDIKKKEKKKKKKKIILKQPTNSFPSAFISFVFNS
jgi:hypothetical protein